MAKLTSQLISNVSFIHSIQGIGNGLSGGLSLVGYAAIIKTLELRLPPPAKPSVVAANFKQHDSGDWRIFTPSYLPNDTLYDQLSFAIKYEGINLLFFKKLFDAVDRQVFNDIILERPLGINRRKIWFLYEWLLEEQLDLADLTEGNYVSILTDKLQYGLAKPINSSRHRIRNNLPGTRDFCPLVYKTKRLNDLIGSNLEQLEQPEIGRAEADEMKRVSANLLLKDSKASFEIEKENPRPSQAAEWARVLGEAGQIRLSIPELFRLQKIVLAGSRFSKFGLRKGGGFIGIHEYSSGTPIPDHISARSADLEKLILGLFTFLDMAYERGLHPVLVAASVGFGFVFIHPFSDGNGRLHRFLLTHVLAFTKFTPPGIVFPLAKEIQNRPDEYREVLEYFSKPLLEFIDWQPTMDGNVEVLSDTIDFYRYFDATRQTEFLFDCLVYTVQVLIPREIQQLRKLDTLKRWLTNEFGIPDRLQGLLIDFLRQGGGKLSKRASGKEFKELTEREQELIEKKFIEIMTEKKQRSIYSLAIMPSAAIAELVADMKQKLKAEVGRSYGSVNAEAHISLDSFEAEEEVYPQILEEYKRVVADLAPFPVSFSGFGDFDGYFRAFYVRLTPGSEDAVRGNYAQVRTDFDKTVKKRFMRKWMDEAKSPHMSIGRRLQPEWVEKAYTLFTDYEDSFLCDHFVIRKYSEKKRQYEVIDVIPLLGTGAQAGTQLSLL